MYKKKLSGNIYYYQEGKNELYSVVCPITGSGWGIPTKDITPKDLRAMADRLELVRAVDKLDQGPCDAEFIEHISKLGHLETEGGDKPNSARPIPAAAYPCRHCSDDFSWLPEDLFWSALDKGWVCDNCWDDRDCNWNGKIYTEEERGVSLAAEIAAQQGEPKCTKQK